MGNPRVAARMAALRAQRLPFVHATVVRAQVPTSAHAGDDAIVLTDGTLEGFVGGQCARSSVQAAALDALRAGKPTLLRVLPEGEPEFPAAPGAAVVVNPCLSGGALEIFLEPVMPPPLVQVVGDTPVADGIVAIAGVLGYAVDRPTVGAPVGGADAVVVASHGLDENDAIRAALDTGVGYIALVASRRRGAAVLDELGLAEGERSRVHTPAGLDIGARTPEEVALSILAQIVTEIRRPDRHPPIPVAAPSTAIDPVCGMTVTVLPDTPHLEIDGTDVWFCNPGCRDHYASTAHVRS